MDPSDFAATVDEAVASLPEWVHKALHNIDVIILDEPDDTPDAAGERLLGLYVGVPLTERGTDYVAELPDVIYIFRKPHLELALPPRELRREIHKTLIHEVAHYFGIDDDHLDDIGWG